MHRWLTLIPLAAAIMAPNILFGPGATDSQLYNYMWTRQFAEAMAGGELYPRWLPTSFEGIGSPTFYFYPPLAYWVSGALDAAGLSTLNAVNAAAFLLLLGSGLSMFAWLRRRSSRPVLGAALYMLAPYHLLDIYTRGALAEFAAFVWLPLIALAIAELPKRWAPPLLALSFAGLILSHLPMALLASIFLIAPLALHRLWQDRSVLAPGVFGGATGLVLAAFYLLPALTLQEHVSMHLLWGTFYQPGSSFIWADLPRQFLITFPPIALAMTLLALPARSIWTAIAAVAAVASMGLIPFIWDIPVLAKVQFPWRLLCIVEFAAITAIAIRPPPRAWLIIPGLLLALSYYGFGTGAAQMLGRWIDYGEVARAMPDAPEYLPRGFDVSEVTDTRRYLDLSRYRPLPGANRVEVEKPGTVTVHRAAFPIWRVMKDRVEVPSRGPLITFEATPGTYRVVRVTLWQEWLGGAVSLAAALLLLAALLRGLRGPAGPATAPRRRRTAAKPS